MDTLVRAVWPELQWLELGHNQITSKGLTILCTSLPKCFPQLQLLGLGASEIEVDCVPDFIQMLRSHPTLSRWHLSSCFIPPGVLVEKFREVFPSLDHFRGSWIKHVSPGSASRSSSHAIIESRGPIVTVVRRPKPVASKDQRTRRRLPKKRQVFVCGTRSFLFQFVHGLLEQQQQDVSSRRATLVREMVLGLAKEIVQAIPHYGTFLEHCSKLQELCGRVRSMQQLTDNQASAVIHELWSHQCVKDACLIYGSMWKFPSDEIGHLFTNVQAVVNVDYIPTRKDIAFARVYLGMEQQLTSSLTTYVLSKQRQPQDFYQVVIATSVNPSRMPQVTVSHPTSLILVTDFPNLLPRDIPLSPTVATSASALTMAVQDTKDQFCCSCDRMFGPDMESRVCHVCGFPFCFKCCPTITIYEPEAMFVQAPCPFDRFCGGCECEFDVNRPRKPRHHCSACGDTFCNNCCPEKPAEEGPAEGRLCVFCQH